MRVLVTGCAGFIGWRVTEQLLAGGHQVAGVDNLVETYDVRLKNWRLNLLKENPRFNFHAVDITQKPALARVFEAAHPEGVVNLAARAGVRASVADPWSYYSTNVTGALNLLDLTRKFEVQSFVQASTSSVYGNAERPFREDATRADRPLSPYAASKKAAEEICYTYHHLYGQNVMVFRYFTVYGPAGRPDMAVFRFVRWIAEGEPITLYGDGSQQRDFTYVDDIARGTVLGLDTRGYNLINLGNNHPVAVNTVIRILEEKLGRKAKIHQFPAHPSDAEVTWAEVSEARLRLGWTPTTTIEQGLGQAVDWYQKNRSWATEISLL